MMRGTRGGIRLAGPHVALSICLDHDRPLCPSIFDRAGRAFTIILPPDLYVWLPGYRAKEEVLSPLWMIQSLGVIPAADAPFLSRNQASNEFMVLRTRLCGKTANLYGKVQ